MLLGVRLLRVWHPIPSAVPCHSLLYRSQQTLGLATGKDAAPILCPMPGFPKFACMVMPLRMRDDGSLYMSMGVQAAACFWGREGEGCLPNFQVVVGVRIAALLH